MSEFYPDGAQQSLERLAGLAPVAVKLCWRAEDEQRCVLDATVEDVITDGLAVLTIEPVPAGRTVWVCWSEERRAVVHHCEGRGERYLVVLRFVSEERRREDRLAVAGDGVLHWHARGGPRQTTGWVKNATEGGLQVELNESLAVHELVRLSGRTWECLGRVRYCRRDGLRFVAGIQFTRPPYPRDSAEPRD